MVCGTPRKLPLSLVPELKCPTCGASLEMFKDERSNYAYRCPQCENTFKLASVVPHWSEEFEYHGFRPDDQGDAERLRTLEEKIRAILAQTRQA